MSEIHVDGNELAGTLRLVFAFDVTAASGICAVCGRRGPLAEVDVYTRAPGLVARCRGCQSVMLRLVQGPGRVWVDMQGLHSLELTPPDVGH